MGRYYDDKVSLAGLDPANPIFGPLRQAAEDIERAEDNFFEQRQQVFAELDFVDDFSRSTSSIEQDYADLINVPVYEYKSTFNDVNPSRNTWNGTIRYVEDAFPASGISDGFATIFYVAGEEDDDGDFSFEVATNVLEYQVGRGKGSIDPLYTGLRAFVSTSSAATDFYVDTSDEDGESFSSSGAVKAGFGEVPLAWRAKGQYSSQQLGVMNAAGNAYEEQVRPVINAYDAKLLEYQNNGGGNLDSDFHSSDNPNFAWKDFQGSFKNYNRPGSLPANLVKQTRGLS